VRPFKYIGPSKIMADSIGSPKGTPIASRDAAVAWVHEHADEEAGWATYVVSVAGMLLVAPRRSEHVACAGGESVLAAGEIRFDAASTVVDVSNNSTGYCPREDCWDAVCSALDRAGLRHPGGLTLVTVFRRCPMCGERNLVKDDWFFCAMCDAALPKRWNFDADG